MWIVVCFEDNTIAAVPQFWYKRGLCAWPKKEPKKCIDRRLKPNKVDFLYLKSKIIKNNISSLIDARSFAKDNSEVSSNKNYVFEENLSNLNKSIKRSCAGSSKEFIVPKLPTVSSEESEKNISRSNSEIDEVQACVSNKKLRVTCDASSSEMPRPLSYGITSNNNKNYENEYENDEALKKMITRSLTCLKREIERVQNRLDSMASLVEKIHDKIKNPSE